MPNLLRTTLFRVMLLRKSPTLSISSPMPLSWSVMLFPTIVFAVALLTKTSPPPSQLHMPPPFGSPPFREMVLLLNTLFEEAAGSFPIILIPNQVFSVTVLFWKMLLEPVMKKPAPLPVFPLSDELLSLMMLNAELVIDPPYSVLLYR